MSQRFTQYTVEDIQRFANSFQPAPWTVRVIRISIPVSTCSAAAQHLISAFGPAELKNVIGGRQWWQLRGNKDGSVEAEWIAMKRDLPRSPSRRSRSASPSKSSPLSGERSPAKSPQVTSPGRPKSFFGPLRQTTFHSAHHSDNQPPAAFQESSQESNSPRSTHGFNHNPTLGSSPDIDPNNSDAHTSNHEQLPSDSYEDDLDKMPCMLYIHGGAYYFGSINTHRYTIWRYARKMGGRAFAVNYRLAPQYPFPCALADCLAAYLYLIRPPEGAKHRAVDPSKIVFAGDSAGGGLSLALLTLIRDIGLPLPAGAVLISPWVDLTHSFPSIMTNAAKDIIPPYGFMHQPSVLWPPPSPGSNSPSKTSHTSQSQSTNDLQVEAAGIAPQVLSPFRPKISSNLKSSFDAAQCITPVIEFDDGEKVVIDQQIQLYATNDQLTHPYCSPLFSPSLGGLPPLLILAGENEVLRDEIIYVAHRAAHPERYPLREDLLNANLERKAKATEYPSTKVHLQVYDEMFHVLPMFSFLRPAKYCYRAIGSFCRYVTKPENETLLSLPAVQSHNHPSTSLDANHVSSHEAQPRIPQLSVDLPTCLPANASIEQLTPPQLTTSRQLRVSTLSLPVLTPAPSPVLRMTPQNLTPIKPPEAIYNSLPEATLIELDQTIYHHLLPDRRPSFADGMIRERVAVDGKIRALEDEAEVDILKISPEELGVIKEGPIRRWAEGRKSFDHKFMNRYKKIQAQRERYFKRCNQRSNQAFKKLAKSAQKEPPGKKKSNLSAYSCRQSPQRTNRSFPRPAQSSSQPENRSSIVTEASIDSEPTAADGLANKSMPGTHLRWVLPEDERPPPSSIAARKDIAEALKLTKVLQQEIVSHHHILNWCRLNRSIDADDSGISPISAS